MSVSKLSKIRPARAPKRVVMPRIRRHRKVAMSLTEAVHRVLVRVHASLRPFGAFSIDGRLVISNSSSDRYRSLMRRSPNALIGTYGPGLKIEDALDDMREHFSDEDAHAVA